MTNSSIKQAYFELVWNFVRQVPSGYVVTYGQIAQSLPAPPALALDLSLIHISEPTRPY